MRQQTELPRRMALKFAFLALLLLPAGLFAQTRVIADSLESQSLDRMARFSVLLPENYDTTRRYPVFYLLHGYGGNHTDWHQRTGLRYYARSWNIIVVMPDAANSFYMNSATDGSQQYEDFIIRELMAHVKENYAVNPRKQGIGGLSMGGYGAVMLGTLHSNEFIFAGSLSGVILPWMDSSIETEAYRRLRDNVLRAVLGGTDHPNVERYDLHMIAKRTEVDRPYIFLAHGIQDSYREFLPGHRAYTDLLRGLDWPYEYHEVPGVHNWVFWDHWLRPMIDKFLKTARSQTR